MPPSNLTESIRIPQPGSNGDGAPHHREVSRSLSMSTSPEHHRKISFGVSDAQQYSYGTSPSLRRVTTGPQPKPLKPFREQDIKILLLENVNQTGRDMLKGQGYQVEFLKSSLPEDQLIEKVK
jgi:D-3-phosphoglycerate dehydrogenase / 2-oxoglutarate reductase